MRMRTMLLLPLVLIPILLTSASLLLFRQQMQRQLRESLSENLRHSAASFRNLEEQRRVTLAREALLLSYQPSLKALMTTQDAATIQDEVSEYAQLSGVEMVALLSPTGRLLALQDKGAAGGGKKAAGKISRLLSNRPEGPESTGNPYLFDGERLFEIAAQPISFGPTENGTLLGYVVLGSLVDDAVARRVSQMVGSEVAFAVGTEIVSTTLEQESRKTLARLQVVSADPGPGPVSLDLVVTKGDIRTTERFLVDRIALAVEAGRPVQLIILNSMEASRRTQRQLNRVVLAIGGAASLAGALLAFFVARNLTLPLEGLATAVAAVGSGDYRATLPASGAMEIRALSSSVESMRAEIRGTQNKLLESERLATIGKMASSVSHDLRHYLSSVYANAEFLAAVNLPEDERADLLAEIRLSVQSTTDLIDSLLLFTRTGRVLHVNCESVTHLVERAIHRVSQHPEASGVSIRLLAESTGEAWVDGKKIERAIYNLALNGCQAAKQGRAKAQVTIAITEEPKTIHIEVRDSGLGVSPLIVDRLFEPFVSANKENGVGIGLTLAATIAQEHGGGIRLLNDKHNAGDGATIFVFTIDREAARQAGKPLIDSDGPMLGDNLQGSRTEL